MCVGVGVIVPGANVFGDPIIVGLVSILKVPVPSTVVIGCKGFGVSPGFSAGSARDSVSFGPIEGEGGNARAVGLMNGAASSRALGCNVGGSDMVWSPSKVVSSSINTIQACRSNPDSKPFTGATPTVKARMPIRRKLPNRIMRDSGRSLLLCIQFKCRS